MPPETAYYENLLTSLIRRVGTHQDTPDLIMIIAADTDHFTACRLIVDPTLQCDYISTPTLERICHQQGWRIADLRKKLMPVATALGIIPTGQVSNPYQVLGVRDNATVNEIKTAFRSQAFTVHPDTTPDPSVDISPIQDLLEAYHTLRDPIFRQSYDANRRQRWHQDPLRLPPSDGHLFVYRWYLGALMIIFIALLLLTMTTNHN